MHQTFSQRSVSVTSEAETKSNLPFLLNFVPTRQTYILPEETFGGKLEKETEAVHFIRSQCTTLINLKLIF